MELIRLENVKKIYQTGEVITKAVDRFYGGSG